MPLRAKKSPVRGPKDIAITNKKGKVIARTASPREASMTVKRSYDRGPRAMNLKIR